MVILPKRKRILAYAGLINTNFLYIFDVNVPRFVIHGVILTTLLAGVLVECLTGVVSYKYGADAILLPFVVSLSCLALIFTYISLNWEDK